jgi:ubiquinone/menaquinone biosynthesis C-methylase UbiE
MQHPSPSATESYSFRDRPTIVQGFARRTAANCAGFLLPHLQAGMRLLDCGCGPGSITLGLAAVVAPGEVVGIDLDAASIDIAQKQTVEPQLGQVRFEVANVYELPFPDASFDVVFSHALLLHIREPVRALKEMKRVLKPGGLIGIRNDDMDGLIIAPPDPLLIQSWELAAELVHRNGGNARGAKHSRAWLREAGFTRVEASASYEYFGTPAETAMWGEGCSSAVRALQQRYAEFGLATSETVDQMCAAWHTWSNDPDAFFAKAWCEAIGWVE